MGINKQLQKAIQDYLESDKLKAHIEDKAEGMINKVIDDSLGHFGGIRKQLDEAVKNEINLNIKELGIAGLNTFIADVVKEKLHTSMRTDAAKKIGEEMDKMLSPMDKVISIEKLKEVLLDDSYTYDLDICGDVTLEMLDGEYGYYEKDVFTFIAETPSENKYEWVNIYMDTQADKRKSECTYNLCVHESFTSYKINDRDVKAQDKIFGNPGVEDFIYGMYLNESTINYADALSSAEEY